MGSCTYSAWGELVCKNKANTTYNNIVESFGEVNNNKLQYDFCNGNSPAAGNVLTPGDFIMSSDKRYKLLFEENGNLSIYDGSTLIWTANVSSPLPKCAVVQLDGNFVLYDNNNGAYWHTNTNGKGQFPHRLSMQKDRNLVLYDAYNRPYWSTGTHVNTYDYRGNNCSAASC